MNISAWFSAQSLPPQALPACIVAQQEQFKRERSAVEGHWELWQDLDRCELWWCISDSEMIYELIFGAHSFVSCSCPDWFYRCQFTGLDCKHIIAAWAYVTGSEVAA